MHLQLFSFFFNSAGNSAANGTTSVATLQLQQFDNNVSRCANFCGHKNIGATHLVILGLTCQCFLDLHTFHCEEEVGEPLANVYCIEKKPESATESDEEVETVLSWRKPLDPLPKSSLYEMGSMNELSLFETTLGVVNNSTESSGGDDDDDDDILSTSTTAIETSAILVGVLLIAAVLLLAGFGVKTCVEMRRQKTHETQKRLQESKETFTTVSIS
jgi:hypothetical protein